MVLLTFIIPVRHQKNARDWRLLKSNLAQTITSIANQTSSDWKGIIVANEGADLPGLPDRFSVKWVDFPPNDIHEQGNATKADFLDAFRADKGRRVLAGMLAARESRFFMIVDDDDLVSSRIVRYVAENRHENGWIIDLGYIWSDGGRFLLGFDKFNQECGTSLIIRSDICGLPARYDEARLDWIKDMLGSHRRVAPMLADKGTPLKTLPFRGAVYRVAHKGSHSKTPGPIRRYVLNKRALRHPLSATRHLMQLRVLSTGLRREFFGLRK